MVLRSSLIKFKNEVGLREHSITITRRIVQIVAFFMINYVILEVLFSINFIAIEGVFKVLPFLHSPRNPLSEGAGFLEYIFFSLAEGVFPFFLVGILILIILLTNRFFCGWICPIGTIQDGCAAIGKKRRRTLKKGTHEKLLKIKFLPLFLLGFLMVTLALTKLFDPYVYESYKNGIFGTAIPQPLQFFSLSEFLFYSLPNAIKTSWETGSILPFFTNFLLLLVYLFYFIVLIGSIWYPRLYCKYFCPFGAAATLINKYTLLKLSRSPVKCVGKAECGKCELVCPKQIRILDEPFEFFTGKGECNYCLMCKEACPYDAINIKFG
ncbi:MAG: 4Fe-4S binding protein [Promethearchaeota archaeon]